MKLNTLINSSRCHLLTLGLLLLSLPAMAQELKPSLHPFPLNTALPPELHDAELFLKLENALWINDRKTDDLRWSDLSLETEIRKAMLPPAADAYACFWEGPLMIRKAYNKADHQWRITAVNTQNDQWLIHARLRVHPDLWNTGGGTGLFKITLTRDQEQLTGTYSGTFNGRQIKGKVQGQLSKLWPTPVEEHQPLAPNEHPRLIFRKSDLPELRRRAQTPEGKLILGRLKAVLAKHDDEIEKETCGYEAAGQAFLYLMTEDQKYADRSREIVTRILGKGYTKGSGRGGNLWRDYGVKRILTAAPAVGVALAYDMCYDTWPEEFRKRVADELEQKSVHQIMGFRKQEYNDNPSSNHYAICNGAGGMAALAIFDEKAEFPAPPNDPTQPITISVITNFKTQSRPTVPYTDGEMPDQWLWAGPYKPESSEQHLLIASGGPSKFHPTDGQTLSHKKQMHRFEPLPSEFILNNKYTNNKNALDLLGPIKRDYHSTIYFYTVINNDQVRTVQYQCPQDNTKAWLAGQAIQHGDILKLSKGPLPLLLEVQVGQTDPWGMIWTTPRFQTLSKDDLDKLHTAYQWERVEWEEARHDYYQRGGTRPIANRMLHLATLHMKRHLRAAHGDHGWYAEGNGYKRYALRQGAFPFMHAYQNVTGRSFINQHHEWMLLSWITQGVIQNNRISMPLYGPGDPYWTSGYTSGDFSLGMGTVSSQYLPAVKWFFDRAYGQQGDQSFDISRPHHAAYLMATYPFGIEEQNPKHTLPKTHRDQQRGGYVFRKNWHDSNDLVATIYTKEQPMPGWNFFDASSFRIIGQGTQWARRGQAGVTSKRGDTKYENSIQVPGTIGRYGATTTSWKGYPDGSGTVSMEIKYPYFKASKNPGQPYIDDGIRGHRAFAVDYAEQSGCDAVYVLYDRTTGVKDSEWVMHTEAKNIKFTDSGFILDNSRGSTLNATFITDAQLKFQQQDDRIIVSGATEYLVVMTLQQGKPPSLQTSMKNSEQLIEVGKLQIRLVDGNIHLDPKIRE